MAYEKQAISVTDKQLRTLAKKILEQNVEVTVSDDVADTFIPSLNDYIQKHQIDVAQFASVEHANSEQANEFVMCFLGNVSYTKEDGLAFYDEPITAALKNYNHIYKVQDKKVSEKLLKENRDLRNLFEAGEKISPHYWLTDSDIDSVLDHLLKDNSTHRQLIAKAIPLKQDRITKELDGTADRAISLPVNIRANHWIRLKITEENGPIYYADPLRTSKDEKLEKTLGDFFPGREIKCDSDGSQHDGWSCGYRAIKKILLDLGINNHPIVKARTSEQMRDAVFGVMAEITKKQPLFATFGASIRTPKKDAADPNGRWDAHHSKTEVLEAFNEIFINENEVKDVKLVDHTVQTNVLTKENLEAFVKSTKALMEKLNLKGEVEVNAPADKKALLIKLCKDHGLKLAAETKAEPAKVEPERMDKTADHRTSVPAL